ncbi:ABC transporter permease [Shimia thalassica]|uniref:ABC transporter permease n=1 Tax=Shimia thalassica TaxID=1715693 RepID=UPI0026E2FA99|nr:ABC transporter permease [Shimia thalassica]MDO6481542.1 ABC transporter permease [Shimia thalassica]
MLTLSVKSLWNRKFVVFLTVLSIALSTALILGVDRLRNEAREGFANSASGLDLIVAPRGNDVQILLATVFGVGSTGAGISWDSFEMFENNPAVSWAVPIMMGDNHRGFPVIGTSETYFEHFRHTGGKPLEFAQGVAFQGKESAVLGAEVAERFDYSPGSVVVNAHGAGSVAFDVHDEAPFVVTGVLERTGTAVDRIVFVPMEGFDALHDQKEDAQADPFAASPETNVMQSDHEAHDDHEANQHWHEPEKINAIFLGLRSKTSVLTLQRLVASYPVEPLSAVMPNVALLSLWSVTGTAETALQIMAFAVALVGVAGMVVMLTASLEARRREFAILRSVGATPFAIFRMIVLEALLVALAGVVLGFVLMSAAIALAAPVLGANYGIYLELSLPSVHEILLAGALLLGSVLASLAPAIRVYRMTLSDGLTMRI